jgi:hypothetical protein
MTDELTPEEKEALKNLPRERMPIGLEARVVEAMREHGFLAQRRRVIALTSGRVAGLLAACVALMIGAYSIGLHRGGVDTILPAAGTVAPDERVRAIAPAVDEAEKKLEHPASDALEAKRTAPAETREKARTASEKINEAEPMVATDAVREDRAREADTKEKTPATPAKSVEELHAQKTDDAPMPSVMAKQFADAPKSEASATSKQSLTFLLNGVPVTVEADSTRIVEDDRGRTLIIYTSGGVIRVPLAASGAQN